MPDIRKCYEILGVKPGAPEDELKQAVRDLVKVWHPDRFAGDPRLQQKAQEKLKEINEAYDTIKIYGPLLATKRSSQPETAPPSTGDGIADRLKRNRRQQLSSDDVKKVADAISMMMGEDKNKRKR